MNWKYHSEGGFQAIKLRALEASEGQTIRCLGSKSRKALLKTIDFGQLNRNPSNGNDSVGSPRSHVGSSSDSRLIWSSRLQASGSQSFRITTKEPASLGNETSQPGSILSSTSSRLFRRQGEIQINLRQSSFPSALTTPILLERKFSADLVTDNVRTPGRASHQKSILESRDEMLQHSRGVETSIAYQEVRSTPRMLEGLWNASPAARSVKLLTGSGIEIPEGVWPVGVKVATSVQQYEDEVPNLFLDRNGNEMQLPKGSASLVSEILRIEPSNLRLPEPGATLVFQLQAAITAREPMLRVFRLCGDSFAEHSFLPTINSSGRIVYSKTLELGGVFALFQIADESTVNGCNLMPPTKFRMVDHHSLDRMALPTLVRSGLPTSEVSNSRLDKVVGRGPDRKSGLPMLAQNVQETNATPEVPYDEAPLTISRASHVRPDSAENSELQILAQSICTPAAMPECRSETYTSSAAFRAREGAYVAVDLTFRYDEVSAQLNARREIKEKADREEFYQLCSLSARNALQDIVVTVVDNIIQLERQKEIVAKEAAEKEFTAKACDFLVVQVIRAAELSIQDKSFKPVIRLSLGPQVRETSRPLKGSRDDVASTVVFNEFFTMRIGKVGKRFTNLKVEALLHDTNNMGASLSSNVNGTMAIGRTTIPLNTLELNTVTKGWHHFEDPNSGECLQMLVGVLRAQDLVPADRGGTSDPYVTVTLDSQKHTTKVVQKSLNPVWNEVFGLDLGLMPPVSDEDMVLGRELWSKARKKLNVVSTAWTSKIVKIQVWDYDIGFGGHDFLGQVLLPIIALQPGHKHEAWYELSGREGKNDNITGSIRLRIVTRIQKNSTKTGGAQQNNSEILPVLGKLELSLLRVRELAEDLPSEIIIKVLRVEGIKTLRQGASSQLYIALSLDGTKWKTQEKQDNDDVGYVEWHEQFQFDAMRLGARILFRLCAPFEGKIKEFGHVEIAVSSLQLGISVEQRLPIMKRQKDGRGSERGVFVSLMLLRRVKSVEAEVLLVTVVQAKGLKAADRGGTSDPFVRLFLDGINVYTTKVVKRTLDPTWNEMCTLTVNGQQNLELEVFDEDLLGTDFLGCCRLHIPALDFDSEADKWLDLQPHFDELRITGSVRLKLHRSKQEQK